MDHLLRPRLIAQRLLRWWAESAPAAIAADADAPTQAEQDVAVPVDEIVAGAGLEVTTFHPSARRGGTLGWLEPGEDLIFLCDDLPDPVRRFTLAHELGHALLHRATGASSLAAALAADLAPTPDASGDLDGEPDAGPPDACDDSDLDTPADPLAVGDEALRPGQAYSARARRESEANAFAAALLLPLEPLRALFLGDGDTPGLDPRSLAPRFGVSEDSVHQALAALLLPGAGETPAARLGASSARPALDRWQRDAAAAQAPALVVAGPGTGKTSTLVGRVAHLVFDGGVDPAHILALTFSNKAAQEMRERLDALLATAEEAHPSSRPTVSTIHAFCGDLLRRYAPLVGLRADYRLISEAEGYLLLRQVAGDLVLPHYQPLATPAMHFPALLAAISRAKDELADPARYAALASTMSEQARTPEERAAAGRTHEVARVYDAYQRALTEAGNADFGDLIRLAVRLLTEQPDVLAELRARHPHLLVDEFQDINRAMGVLLQVLAGPDGQLWAVGDADQAIYRFRGASPANLARFAEAYPTAHTYSLGTNYRSRPPILRAAAAVAGAFLDERERAVLEAGYQTAPTATAAGEERPPQGSAITLATAPDEAAELAGLVAAIQARVARGYALGDQAVLCRTRRQCQRVAAALDDAGLAARVVTPLLDQPLVKDVLAVVLLLVDGSGAGLLRAGAIPDHAFSRAEAHVVLREAHARHESPVELLLDGGSILTEVPDISPHGLDSLFRLGEILDELWLAPDVATGLSRYMFALTGLGQRALTATSPEGRLQAATLARLLTLARAFEDQRRGADPGLGRAQVGGARWDEFVDYVRVLAALGRDVGGNADDLLGSAADGVRVLTVHGSKGLEFPIVYLPGLGDGRFPTQRRGDPTPPPAGLSEEASIEARDATATHLAEEACLFYVAITRARDELVISHAERYGRRRCSPSPFLRPLMALDADTQSGVERVRWPSAAQPAAQEHAPAAIATPADVEPGPPQDEPLRVGAIETYQRCPRQYAYRYVYQLRPREVGLGTLRRGLHETLRDLQARFAATDTPAHDRTQAVAPPTLPEARALFERHWRAAVAADAAAAQGSELSVPDRRVNPDGPFGALYRRHGQRVVERAWLDLARERGLPLPEGADVATQSDRDELFPTPLTLPDTDARADAQPTGEMPRPAPMPLAARLEERVVVRVGGREIEVTLDRVEGERTVPEPRGGVRAPIAADVAPPDAAPADAQPISTRAPVRFVRHRLGRGPATASPADLRSLLYALAAEQDRRTAPAELYQHNLTTGELERVRLDPKRQQRLRESLVEALAGMESGAYPARPDPITCQACPFLLVCPA